MEVQLANLQEELHSARNKWYYIGLMLKIPQNELDVIKAQHSGNAQDCLLEMLILWLRRIHPMPRWKFVVEALRTKSVAENTLADSLEKKYFQGMFGVATYTAVHVIRIHQCVTT